MTQRDNPAKHHRQSIRLRGWDYTTPGAYFVTICTHQRECLFDNLSFKEVAENAWRFIPNQAHARHTQLDEWVVMPNHVHGILVIVSPVGARPGEDKLREQAQVLWPGLALTPPEGDFRVDEVGARPPEDDFREQAEVLSGGLASTLKPGSIGAIVGNFKSLVAGRINNLRRKPGQRVWQRGYYDRIIRNERELNAIRQYIQDNPRRWNEDRDNLDALLRKMRYHP
jgi:REP element-mobilizing transposase RayT